VREDILEKVATDLLSIPPLIFREIRGKLIKTTLADIDVDITPLHFEIIRLLEKEGKLHVTEIGNRLRIAKAQMTKLTDKLVDLKLVERQTDVTDRRTCIITLSPRGKAVLEEHRASIMNAIRETMRQLSDEDLRNLSNTLRKLQDILSKLN
jgi:MarR family 2-MHQ and catechol resistance regulon transcriptional repressor